MKKIIKIGVGICVFGVVGAGGYFGYQKFFQETTSVDTGRDGFNQNISFEVLRQDFISSLNFSGNTKIKNQQKLKFPGETKVTGIYAQVGQSVEKGFLIAEIDKANLLTEIEILKIRLTNAELNLKKVKENTSTIELKRAEVEYEKLQNDLKNKKENYDFFIKELDQKITDAQKNLNNKKLYFGIAQKEVNNAIAQIKKSPETLKQDILQAENNLVSLQIEYEREKKNFDANVLQKQNQYFLAIQKEYVAIQSTIHSLNKNFEELDTLLQLKGEGNYDNQAMIYFSAKDTQYKNIAQSAMQGAYAKFLKLEEEFKKLPKDATIEQIVSLSDLQINMYHDIWIASDAMMKGLDKSIETEGFDSGKISSFYSLANSLYSQAFDKKTSIKNIEVELNNLKTPDEIKKDMDLPPPPKNNQIISSQLALQKLKDESNLSIETLDYKITQEQDKIIDMKKEIENLERELQQLAQNRGYEINIKNKEIEIQELELSQTLRKLNEIRDTDNNQELVVAENEYKQAKVVLENEQAKIANYEIRAPFDGIVTRIDYVVGDNLTSNDEKYILIENPEILEISIFADQVDITKLQKGQMTQISYDAFPGVEFEGEIIEVDSTPQDQDGMTKYEVKILVAKSTQKIFSGMQANVVIVTEKKEQVLMVPFTAVKVDEQSGESFVSVIDESGKITKRQVQVGFSDGNNSEILEGLSEGEKVLEIDYNANTFQPQDFEMGGYY